MIHTALTGVCHYRLADSDGSAQPPRPAGSVGYKDFLGAINSAGALTITCSNAKTTTTWSWCWETSSLMVRPTVSLNTLFLNVSPDQSSLTERPPGGEFPLIVRNVLSMVIRFTKRRVPTGEIPHDTLELRGVEM